MPCTRTVPEVDAPYRAPGRAVILRVEIPQARVEGIDAKKARSRKGVACDLTANGIDLHGIAFQDPNALYATGVCNIGDPLSLVSAGRDEIGRETPKEIRDTNSGSREARRSSFSRTRFLCRIAILRSRCGLAFIGCMT